MITASFDIVQFMEALNHVREARGLTWYDVFRDTGVYGVTAESTRKRWLRGRGNQAMSVHTMVALATWAGLDVRQFIKQGVKSAR